ncbi:LysR family transcriptional regulator [Mangrovibacter yixingensis]|uniref:LysR family transcriptional regulator n=1 Tax=Mangrovibacter yixingensis TaxID=1529639 RepID=UPI001CFDB235|nr:LysR family transcriptional regulator [Mangrovibacter yixingensis]
MALLDDLTSLRIFERIVAGGSLSSAARDLGLSLAVVSKRLSELERRMAIRLINRSTRQLSVTEEGALFYDHCMRILAAAEQAEEAMTGRNGRVFGTLRLSAPHGLGRRYIVPALAAFTEQYPEVNVDVSLNDEIVDLVAGGYDLAIRYGTPNDSRLFVRPLAPNRRLLCASPAYLARKGIPETVQDLTHHDCILIGHSPAVDWAFNEGDTRISVKVQGRYVCDDGAAAHELALCGAGIVMKSIWDVGDDVLAGRLIEVLPGDKIPAAPLNAVYLHSRFLAPRVRLFVAFLTERMSQAWKW